METVSIKIEKTQHEALKSLAKKRGMLLRRVVWKALAVYLARAVEEK